MCVTVMLSLSRVTIEMLSPKLVEALKRTSQNIYNIDCVKNIWWHFYKMCRILHKDIAKLKPGCSVGSPNADDYKFGLNDEKIATYVNHAKIFFSPQ